MIVGARMYVPRMQVLRSPRALVAALAAAVTAYAYVAVRGAPGPIAWLAALGESSLDARGGVRLAVTLDAPAAPAVREQVARIAAARLAAHGAEVHVEEHGAELALDAIGVPPERGPELARALGMRGELSLRPVLEHGAAVDRLAAAQAAGVRLDRDVWQSDDGRRHEVPFLAAPDRAALARAAAAIDASPDQILIERVEPGGDSVHGTEYRTYVVGPDAIVDNHDIDQASPGLDPNSERPIVDLTFTRAGAERFGDWTTAHVGDKLAIVVDGEVTSAPVVNTPIHGGRAIITMGSGASLAQSTDQARALAAALQSREVLPAPVHVRVTGTYEPSVARAHLARFVGAIAAALVALAIAFVLARSRALEPAPVPVGDRRGALRIGPVAARLAVTLAIPLALALLAAQPLPVPLDPIAPGPVASIRVGAIGVMPVMSAFLLVELAALAIPAWRRRRHGDRQPLVIATAALAAALAIVQAWLVADWLRSFGATPSPWLVTAVLVAPVALAALGAAAIERWGLGNGWSVIVAGPIVAALVVRVRATALAPLAVSLGAAALVVILALGAARTRIRGGSAALRLPLGGVAGPSAMPALLAIALEPIAFVPGLAGVAFELTRRATQPIAVVLIATAFAGGLGAVWSRRLAGGARVAAIVVSIALAAAIASLELFARHAAGAELGLALALVAAVIADVATEARARARGAWREIARLHDVEHADVMLAAGGRTARGLHVRALYRFFAPFAPIAIYEREP
jgi:hypothetical protein